MADGTNLKSSVLAATNSDLLLSLLDFYAAAALRERSNAGVARTLDEQIADLLREALSFPLQQHIANKVLSCRRSHSWTSVQHSAICFPSSLGAFQTLVTS